MDSGLLLFVNKVDKMTADEEDTQPRPQPSSAQQRTL